MTVKKSANITLLLRSPQVARSPVENRSGVNTLQCHLSQIRWQTLEIVPQMRRRRIFAVWKNRFVSPCFAVTDNGRWADARRICPMAAPQTDCSPSLGVLHR